ncbi:alpha-glucosidase/alpha-galactosidase, partial [Schumannella luteola]
EEGAAEYAPQIIHSMLTGTEREIHTNVVNRGLIDNLPEGAVVEVPSRVDAAGVTPLAVGAIPTAGAALNRTYLSVAELTIEAARTGSRELVHQAVLVDPNASSSLTPAALASLVDEMLDAHKPLMPRSLGGDVDLVLP